eukprot:353989-Rhodomonas_salina.6
MPGTEERMVLCACYAMRGTEERMVLHACYAMRGTKDRMAMRGTEVGMVGQAEQARHTRRDSSAASAGAQTFSDHPA